MPTFVSLLSKSGCALRKALQYLLSAPQAEQKAFAWHSLQSSEDTSVLVNFVQASSSLGLTGRRRHAREQLGHLRIKRIGTKFTHVRHGLPLAGPQPIEIGVFTDGTFI